MAKIPSTKAKVRQLAQSVEDIKNKESEPAEPLLLGTNTVVPAIDRERGLVTEDAYADARLDNAPLDPALRGFFRIPGSDFKELLALSRSLNEEQERHVREHLSEVELVIFDILTRPAPELSAEERAELKKMTKDLLEKLKQLLVLNWRQTVAARSRVKLAIKDMLDQGLPCAYTPELYKQKCSAVFEHVYEAYGDRGVSLYTQTHGI